MLTSNKYAPRYYHVSLKSNHASISKSGVDPVFSRGKQSYSWWVSGPMIAWAIAHMAHRYDEKVSAFEVWSAPRSDIRNIKGTGMHGVIKTPCRVSVHDAIPAVAYLKSGV